MSTSPELPHHVIDEFQLEHWNDDDTSFGRAPILPGMLVPGTEYVRIGILTVLADVVAGQPSTGAITPTTDINVQLARVRTMGQVRLVAKVLKAGATLLVTRTLLMADDDEEPFAVSMATFMNRRLERFVPRVERPGVELTVPLAERIGARFLAPGTVELDPRDDLSNGHHGTVQGGVVATLGELSAASLADGLRSEGDGPAVVTDIEVRFLNRVKVGPARAVAEVLLEGPGGRTIGVAISDVGDGGRLTAYVVARVVPANRFAP